MSIDNNQTTSKANARTQEALENISTYYQQKIDSDYDKIVEMIESGDENLTRQDFIKTLGISNEVLDSFFNLVVRGCEGDQRDAICDRLISINKDDLGKIVKRLKNDNIRLEDEITELQEVIQMKEEEIHRLVESDSGNTYENDSFRGYENDSQDVVELTANIENLQSENAQLNSTIYELNNTINTLNNEKWELQNTISELEASVMNPNSGTDYQSEQYGYENNDERYEELSNSLTEKSIELERKEEEILSLNRQIEDLEYSLGEKNRVIDSLREQLEHAEHERTKVESSIETYTAPQQEDELFNNGIHHEQQAEFEFGEMLNTDQALPKKKSKTGLYVIIGIFFVIFLALISVVMLNNSNEGPVHGTPTQLKTSDKTTGSGLGPNVANGAATQIAPTPTNIQTPAQQVQGAVPTQLAQDKPQTNTSGGIIKSLNTPYNFRQNAKSFSVTENGLVVDGQTFKVGDNINGFKVLVIQKSFARFLDSKSDLEFRVDLGA